MSTDIFECSNWGSIMVFSAGGARDAAKPPIRHKTVANNKEQPGPRCQHCQCWESGYYTKLPATMSLRPRRFYP